MNNSKNCLSRLILGVVYVFLASTLAMGFTSDLMEEESKLVNDVLKDLPLAICDMIVISSSPFYGKLPLIIKYLWLIPLCYLYVM